MTGFTNTVFRNEVARTRAEIVARGLAKAAFASRAFIVTVAVAMLVDGSELRAQRPAVARTSAVRFAVEEFRSAALPARAVNPMVPFAGAFHLVDSAFVALDGGMLTVTTGSVYLLASGAGLARVTSERRVSGGVVVQPDPAHTHATLVDITDVLAVPDGRVSLLGLWERPSAGFQTSNGAIFADSAPSPSGARAVSRLHLTRVYPALHETEGVYVFSGRGRTRSTRSDIPFEERERSWQGELVFVPDADSSRAYVVVAFRNEAGGGRDFGGPVSMQGGSFVLEREFNVSAESGVERFSMSVSVKNGRLTGTWIRRSMAGTLEERGTLVGARK